MSIPRPVGLCATWVMVALLASVTARADQHPYSEGEVLNVTRIRTEPGHFEDYMKYLARTWRVEQEAAKKAGYIESYRILTAQPRGPDDADVILVIRYKNWAAMDGWIVKGDEIEKKVEGSLTAADKAFAARGKIRRVLGGSNMQVLNLRGSTEQSSASPAPAAASTVHPYSEGPIVKVGRIRTEYGHFEDYLKYLDTTWRAAAEEAKKEGQILGYEVLLAEPRDASDPDILLVTTYANWAALDGWIAKGDEVRAKVIGSIESATKAASERIVIRHVLGTSTMQVLNFK